MYIHRTLADSKQKERGKVFIPESKQSGKNLNLHISNADMRANEVMAAGTAQAQVLPTNTVTDDVEISFCVKVTPGH